MKADEGAGPIYTNRTLTCLRKCAVHGRSGFVLHGRLYVAVDAECHAQTGMAQGVLHDLGVDVLPPKQRGARMPEVVEADIGEADSLQKRLEVAVHYVLRVQRR